MNEKDRLLAAQWILERNIGWITTAEVKVGVVVAFGTAMMGGLAAAFGASDGSSKSAWAYLFLVTAAVALSISLACAAMSIFPRLNGPSSSFLFFGRIAEKSVVEYTNDFCRATDEELLKDWCAQIHRNAEIARDKHAWVRKSMGWAFFGAIPWAGAIALLSKF